MNFAQQFEILGRKQLVIQEGIDLLRQVQAELRRSKVSAEGWSMAAILANAALIPLNCVVNAFELKAANTAYQALVRQLYGQFGKSGSRLDGHAKTALSALKQAIIEELKRKAMTDFIPGVNILVGLAEDSMALWRAVQLVTSGNREMQALVQSLDKKIDAATRELIQLGIKRAEIHRRMHAISRTA